MYLLLAFAVALLLATYLSGFAERTVFPLASIFIIAGLLVGRATLNLFQPSNVLVDNFIRVALVTILFTDGMSITTRNLKNTWRLPVRALFIGLPLTLLLMTVLAVWMIGLHWYEALLVAAVLSPTDPVFASALASAPRVPEKLRRLINIESGFNDGLALPIVLTVLAIMNQTQFQPLEWAKELVIGIVIGFVVTWAAAKLSGISKMEETEIYEPLLGVSIGVLVFSLTSLLNGNEFLAAFTAGITLDIFSPECSRAFLKIGEPISELMKLIGVMIFSSLLSIQFFAGITWIDVAFAFVLLLLARPIGLNLALIGSVLNWKERAIAGWFGPRGFASVVYGLLVYRAGAPNAPRLFQLIALIVVISILIHSSSSAPAIRWLVPKNPKENEANLED